MRYSPERKFYFPVLLSLAAQLVFGRDSEKPNIIIIYADDLGYGDVSCYGANSISTPNIDRLEKQGLRFTNAHCTSATSTPSRYSLLTISKNMIGIWV